MWRQFSRSGHPDSQDSEMIALKLDIKTSSQANSPENEPSIVAQTEAEKKSVFSRDQFNEYPLRP
jgi:hypothetical protein